MGSLSPTTSSLVRCSFIHSQRTDCAYCACSGPGQHWDPPSSPGGQGPRKGVSRMLWGKEGNSESGEDKEGWIRVCQVEKGIEPHTGMCGDGGGLGRRRAQGWSWLGHAKERVSS